MSTGSPTPLSSPELFQEVVDPPAPAAQRELAETQKLRSAAAEVLKYTETLFGGPAALHEACDPEFPSNYLVVSVVATGDVDHLVALNDMWHRGIRDVAGKSSSHYRLSLDIR